MACEAEGATACMLTGGLWYFSIFAVIIKVLTDLIVCGWVGVSYHSNVYMA